MNATGAPKYRAILGSGIDNGLLEFSVLDNSVYPCMGFNNRGADFSRLSLVDKSFATREADVAAERYRQPGAKVPWSDATLTVVLRKDLLIREKWVTGVGRGCCSRVRRAAYAVDVVDGCACH